MDDDVVADFYGRAVLRSRNTMNTMNTMISTSVCLFFCLFPRVFILPISNVQRENEVKPKTSGVVLSGSVNKNLLLSRQHDRVA